MSWLAKEVSRLHYSVWHDNITEVKRHLNTLSPEKKSKLLLATDDYGRTALTLAAAKGAHQLAKLILDSIPLNKVLEVMGVQDTGRNTPLHYAALMDDVETIQIMLEFVPLSSRLPLLLKQNCEHKTPLEVAEYWEEGDTAELLKRLQEQLMSEETNIGGSALEDRVFQLVREELANHSKEQTTRNQALEEEVARLSALLEKQATLLEAKTEQLDKQEEQIEIQGAENMITRKEANNLVKQLEKNDNAQEVRINDLTKRLDTQEAKFHAQEMQLNAHERRLHAQETRANVLGNSLTALQNELASLEAWIGYEPNQESLMSQLEDFRNIVDEVKKNLSILEKKQEETENRVQKITNIIGSFLREFLELHRRLNLEEGFLNQRMSSLREEILELSRMAGVDPENLSRASPSSQ